ncbi:hypothetical protein [Desulfosporosinus sp. SB140]|uniref:hypothetical protein n=1 Tax=Desulfosporosinus paludis TaxID=3115649 RepID=UPI003890BC10
MRESLVRWHQGLKQLPLDGEQLRDALQALTLVSIKSRLYEPVRRPALLTYEQEKQRSMQQLLQLEQQKQSLLTDRQTLEQELEEWNLAREPEPARTEGRTSSRQQRSQGTGAPLFSACEFEAALTESEQAQLEETLEQAGLLDAWILPGGR